MIRTAGYLVWRLCRITCGFVLLVAGVLLSLPGIPGPGVVLIVVSFGILSRDFHWAGKVNAYLKQKWHDVLNRRKHNSTMRKNDDG